MKRMFIFLLAAAVILLVSCSSDPAAALLGPAPEYREETDTYVVVDHKTKAIGEDVPEWVSRYIADGVAGVEAMPLYTDSYVFIAEDIGTNLNALRQWASGFTVAQDLARMVSTRVQLRFENAASGSPDDAYGRYFENVVRTVTNTSFSGARKETDFWILKRYFKADGKTIDREAYEYYLLVSIDKELLQRQINIILNRVTADTVSARNEAAAVERVTESFYEGF